MFQRFKILFQRCPFVSVASENAAVHITSPCTLCRRPTIQTWTSESILRARVNRGVCSSHC